MFRKLGEKLRNFMYGRYGTDQLNTCLLIVGVVLCLLSMIPKLYFLGFISFIPLIVTIFRMYSRNIYKRRRENQAFLRLLAPIRDRKNRYFKCPKCHQHIRVPRGKGKIVIRCPSCGEKFTKKT